VGKLKEAPPLTFEDAAQRVAAECVGLLVSKHRDYGPLNILAAPFGAERALIVRCHDKLARLAHLVEQGKTPAHESVEDSWRDLANYALIALMAARGWFSLAMETVGERGVKDG